MKIRNIVITIIPDDAYGEITTSIPSLGIAVISSYLSAHGYNHEIKDLFRETWLNPNLMRFTKLFRDRERVIKYANGANDDELDMASAHLLGKTPLKDGSIFAYSMDMAPYFSRFGALICLSRYVKSKCECVTIAGGLVYSDFLKDFVQSEFLDYAISSLDIYSITGHYSFVQLLKKLEGGDVDYANIPGLIYKDDAMTRQNAPVDSEPFYSPDFSKFNLDRYSVKIPSLYSTDKPNRVNVLPYRFTAGCRCNCAYCYMSRFKEMKILDPERIVCQLRNIKESTGCDNFIFLNPCVNTHNDVTMELANRLIDSGINIKWSDCAMFENMDRPLVKALAESGCRRLYFGFESLTRNIKRYVTKKLDIQHILTVLELCAEYNIWVGLDIINGFPYETREEVSELSGFIKKHADLIDSVTINKFMLFLHTKFYNEANKFKITPHPTPLLDAIGGVPFSETEGRDRAEISEDAEWGYRLLVDTANESIGYCSDSDMLPILFWMYENYGPAKNFRKQYKEVIKRFQTESDMRKPDAITSEEKPSARQPAKTSHDFKIDMNRKPVFVKITVKSVSNGDCPAHHHEHQEFFVKNGCTPDGLCLAAFNSISQSLIAMTYSITEKHRGPENVSCEFCKAKVRFELRISEETPPAHFKVPALRKKGRISSHRKL